MTAMAKATQVHGSTCRDSSVTGMSLKASPDQSQVKYGNHAEHDRNRGDVEHIERSEAKG